MQKTIMIVALFFSCAVSAANDAEGLYVTLGAGQSYGQDQSYTLTENTTPIQIAPSFKQTHSYQFAIGYTYPQLSWLSTELTLNYNPKLNIHSDRLYYSNAYHAQISQLSIESTTLLLNNRVDLARYFNRQDWVLHPYIGFGVGVSRNRLSNFVGVEADLSTKSTLDNGNTRTDFAWQTQVGVTYALTQQVELDLSYAFNDYGKISSAATTKNSSSYKAYKMDYTTQQIMLNVRYFFSADRTER